MYRPQKDPFPLALRCLISIKGSGGNSSRKSGNFSISAFITFVFVMLFYLTSLPEKNKFLKMKNKIFSKHTF